MKEKPKYSVFSRAMRVLLSVVLVIGLMPTLQLNTSSASAGEQNINADASGSVVINNDSTDKSLTDADVSVYRLYNGATSEHLLTTSESEYNALPDSGWTQEGVAWYASSKTNTKGVYRLYNAALGAQLKTSHHYTTDLDEAKQLVASQGWQWDNEVDGTPTPVFYSAEDENGAISGTTSVERLYNDALSAHLFSKDASECEQLVSAQGWVDEGVSFYAFTQGVNTTSDESAADTSSQASSDSAASDEQTSDSDEADTTDVTLEENVNPNGSSDDFNVTVYGDNGSKIEDAVIDFESENTICAIVPDTDENTLKTISVTDKQNNPVEDVQVNVLNTSGVLLASGTTSKTGKTVVSKYEADTDANGKAYPLSQTLTTEGALGGKQLIMVTDINGNGIQGAHVKVLSLGRINITLPDSCKDKNIRVYAEYPENGVGETGPGYGWDGLTINLYSKDSSGDATLITRASGKTANGGIFISAFNEGITNKDGEADPVSPVTGKEVPVHVTAKDPTTQEEEPVVGAKVVVDENGKVTVSVPDKYKTKDIIVQIRDEKDQDGVPDVPVEVKDAKHDSSRASGKTDDDGYFVAPYGGSITDDKGDAYPTDQDGNTFPTKVTYKTDKTDESGQPVYEPVPGAKVSIDEQGKTTVVVPEEYKKDDIRVQITDEDGNPQQGKNVCVKDSDGSTRIDDEKTDAKGIVDAPANKGVTDTDGKTTPVNPESGDEQPMKVTYTDKTDPKNPVEKPVVGAKVEIDEQGHSTVTIPEEYKSKDVTVTVYEPDGKTPKGDVPVAIKDSDGSVRVDGKTNTKNGEPDKNANKGEIKAPANSAITDKDGEARPYNPDNKRTEVITVEAYSSGANYTKGQKIEGATVEISDGKYIVNLPEGTEKIDVKVTVKTASKQAISNVEVDVYNANGFERGFGNTDTDGVYISYANQGITDDEGKTTVTDNKSEDGIAKGLPVYTTEVWVDHDNNPDTDMIAVPSAKVEIKDDGTFVVTMPENVTDPDTGKQISVADKPSKVRVTTTDDEGNQEGVEGKDVVFKDYNSKQIGKGKTDEEGYAYKEGNNEADTDKEGKADVLDPSRGNERVYIDVMYRDEAFAGDEYTMPIEGAHVVFNQDGSVDVSLPEAAYTHDVEVVIYTKDGNKNVGINGKVVRATDTKTNSKRVDQVTSTIKNRDGVARFKANAGITNKDGDTTVVKPATEDTKKAPQNVNVTYTDKTDPENPVEKPVPGALVEIDENGTTTVTLPEEYKDKDVTVTLTDPEDLDEQGNPKPLEGKDVVVKDTIKNQDGTTKNPTRIEDKTDKNGQVKAPANQGVTDESGRAYPYNEDKGYNQTTTVTYKTEDGTSKPVVGAKVEIDEQGKTTVTVPEAYAKYEITVNIQKKDEDGSESPIKDAPVQVNDAGTKDSEGNTLPDTIRGRGNTDVAGNYTVGTNQGITNDEGEAAPINPADGKKYIVSVNTYKDKTDTSGDVPVADAVVAFDEAGKISVTLPEGVEKSDIKVSVYNANHKPIYSVDKSSKLVSVINNNGTKRIEDEATDKDSTVYAPASSAITDTDGKATLSDGEDLYSINLSFDHDFNQTTPDMSLSGVKVAIEDGVVKAYLPDSIKYSDTYGNIKTITVPDKTVNLELKKQDSDTGKYEPVEGTLVWFTNKDAKPTDDKAAYGTDSTNTKGIATLKGKNTSETNWEGQTDPNPIDPSLPPEEGEDGNITQPKLIVTVEDIAKIGTDYANAGIQGAQIEIREDGTVVVTLPNSAINSGVKVTVKKVETTGDPSAVVARPVIVNDTSSLDVVSKRASGNTDNQGVFYAYTGSSTTNQDGDTTVTKDGIVYNVHATFDHDNNSDTPEIPLPGAIVSIDDNGEIHIISPDSVDVTEDGTTTAVSAPDKNITVKVTDPKKTDEQGNPSPAKDIPVNFEKNVVNADGTVEAQNIGKDTTDSDGIAEKQGDNRGTTDSQGVVPDPDPIDPNPPVDPDTQKPTYDGTKGVVSKVQYQADNGLWTNLEAATIEFRSDGVAKVVLPDGMQDKNVRVLLKDSDSNPVVDKPVLVVNPDGTKRASGKTQTQTVDKEKWGVFEAGANKGITGNPDTENPGKTSPLDPSDTQKDGSKGHTTVTVMGKDADGNYTQPIGGAEVTINQDGSIEVKLPEGTQSQDVEIQVTDPDDNNKGLNGRDVLVLNPDGTKRIEGQTETHSYPNGTSKDGVLLAPASAGITDGPTKDDPDAPGTGQTTVTDPTDDPNPETGEKGKTQVTVMGKDEDGNYTEPIGGAQVIIADDGTIEVVLPDGTQDQDVEITVTDPENGNKGIEGRDVVVKNPDGSTRVEDKTNEQGKLEAKANQGITEPEGKVDPDGTGQGVPGQGETSPLDPKPDPNGDDTQTPAHTTVSIMGKDADGNYTQPIGGAKVTIADDGSIDIKLPEGTQDTDVKIKVTDTQGKGINDKTVSVENPDGTQRIKDKTAPVSGEDGVLLAPASAGITDGPTKDDPDAPGTGQTTVTDPTDDPNPETGEKGKTQVTVMGKDEDGNYTEPIGGAQVIIADDGTIEVVLPDGTQDQDVEITVTDPENGNKGIEGRDVVVKNPDGSTRVEDKTNEQGKLEAKANQGITEPEGKVDPDGTGQGVPGQGETSPLDPKPNPDGPDTQTPAHTTVAVMGKNKDTGKYTDPIGGASVTINEDGSINVVLPESTQDIDVKIKVTDTEGYGINNKPVVVKNSDGSVRVLDQEKTHQWSGDGKTEDGVVVAPCNSAKTNPEGDSTISNGDKAYTVNLAIDTDNDGTPDKAVPGATVSIDDNGKVSIVLPEILVDENGDAVLDANNNPIKVADHSVTATLTDPKTGEVTKDCISVPVEFYNESAPETMTYSDNTNQKGQVVKPGDSERITDDKGNATVNDILVHVYTKDAEGEHPIEGAKVILGADTSISVQLPYGYKESDVYVDLYNTKKPENILTNTVKASDLKQDGSLDSKRRDTPASKNAEKTNISTAKCLRNQGMTDDKGIAKPVDDNYTYIVKVKVKDTDNMIANAIVSINDEGAAVVTLPAEYDSQSIAVQVRKHEKSGNEFNAQNFDVTLKNSSGAIRATKQTDSNGWAYFDVNIGTTGAGNEKSDPDPTNPGTTETIPEDTAYPYNPYTQKSQPTKVTYTDENGKEQPVLGAEVEIDSDGKTTVTIPDEYKDKDVTVTVYEPDGKTPIGDMPVEVKDSDGSVRVDAKTNTENGVPDKNANKGEIKAPANSAITNEDGIAKPYNPATKESQPTKVTYTDTDGTEKPLPGAKVEIDPVTGKGTVTIPDEYKDKDVKITIIDEDENPITDPDKQKDYVVKDEDGSTRVDGTTEKGVLEAPANTGTTDTDGKTTPGAPENYTVEVMGKDASGQYTQPIAGAIVTINEDETISVLLPDGTQDTDVRVGVFDPDNMVPDATGKLSPAPVVDKQVTITESDGETDRIVDNTDAQGYVYAKAHTGITDKDGDTTVKKDDKKYHVNVVDKDGKPVEGAIAEVVGSDDDPANPTKVIVTLPEGLEDNKVTVTITDPDNVVAGKETPYRNLPVQVKNNNGTTRGDGDPQNEKTKQDGTYSPDIHIGVTEIIENDPDKDEFAKATVSSAALNNGNPEVLATYDVQLKWGTKDQDGQSPLAGATVEITQDGFITINLPDEEQYKQAAMTAKITYAKDYDTHTKGDPAVGVKVKFTFGDDAIVLDKDKNQTGAADGTGTSDADGNYSSNKDGFVVRGSTTSGTTNADGDVEPSPIYDPSNNYKGLVIKVEYESGKDAQGNPIYSGVEAAKVYAGTDGKLYVNLDSATNAEEVSSKDIKVTVLDVNKNPVVKKPVVVTNSDGSKRATTNTDTKGIALVKASGAITNEDGQATVTDDEGNKHTLTVTDEDGNPIAGASVVVEGSGDNATFSVDLPNEYTTKDGQTKKCQDANITVNVKDTTDPDNATPESNKQVTLNVDTSTDPSNPNIVNRGQASTNQDGDVNFYVISNQNSTFEDIEDRIYSASAQTPTVTGSYNGSSKLGSVDLAVNKNVVLSYENNTNVTLDENNNPDKKAVVKVTGIGNYSGTAYVYFKINPATITLKDGDFSASDKTYDATSVAKLTWARPQTSAIATDRGIYAGDEKTIVISAKGEFVDSATSTTPNKNVAFDSAGNVAARSVYISEYKITDQDSALAGYDANADTSKAKNYVVSADNSVKYCSAKILQREVPVLWSSLSDDDAATKYSDVSSTETFAYTYNRLDQGVTSKADSALHADETVLSPVYYNNTQENATNNPAISGVSGTYSPYATNKGVVEGEALSVVLNNQTGANAYKYTKKDTNIKAQNTTFDTDSTGGVYTAKATGFVATNNSTDAKNYKLETVSGNVDVTAQTFSIAQASLTAQDVSYDGSYYVDGTDKTSGVLASVVDGADGSASATIPAKQYAGRALEPSVEMTQTQNGNNKGEALVSRDSLDLEYGDKDTSDYFVVYGTTSGVDTHDNFHATNNGCVTVSATLNGNYTSSQHVSFDITQAPIKITWSADNSSVNKTKTVSEKGANFSHEYTNQTQTISANVEGLAQYQTSNGTKHDVVDSASFSAKHVADSTTNQVLIEGYNWGAYSGQTTDAYAYSSEKSDYYLDVESATNDATDVASITISVHPIDILWQEGSEAQSEWSTDYAYTYTYDAIAHYLTAHVKGYYDDSEYEDALDAFINTQDTTAISAKSFSAKHVADSVSAYNDLRIKGLNDNLYDQTPDYCVGAGSLSPSVRITAREIAVGWESTGDSWTENEVEGEFATWQEKLAALRQTSIKGTYGQATYIYNKNNTMDQNFKYSRSAHVFNYTQEQDSDISYNTIEQILPGQTAQTTVKIKGYNKDLTNNTPDYTLAALDGTANTTDQLKANIKVVARPLETSWSDTVTTYNGDRQALTATVSDYISTKLEENENFAYNGIKLTDYEKEPQSPSVSLSTLDALTQDNKVATGDTEASVSLPGVCGNEAGYITLTGGAGLTSRPSASNTPASFTAHDATLTVQNQGSDLSYYEFVSNTTTSAKTTQDGVTHNTLGHDSDGNVNTQIVEPYATNTFCQFIILPQDITGTTTNNLDQAQGGSANGRLHVSHTGEAYDRDNVTDLSTTQNHDDCTNHVDCKGDTDAHTYRGADWTESVYSITNVTSDVDSNVLSIDTNEIYKHTDNTAINAGNYTFTVYAKGNYTGSISHNYSIVPFEVNVGYSDWYRTGTKNKDGEDHISAAYNTEDDTYDGISYKSAYIDQADYGRGIIRYNWDAQKPTIKHIGVGRENTENINVLGVANASLKTNANKGVIGGWSSYTTDAYTATACILGNESSVALTGQKTDAINNNYKVVQTSTLSPAYTHIFYIYQHAADNVNVNPNAINGTSDVNSALWYQKPGNASVTNNKGLAHDSSVDVAWLAQENALDSYYTATYNSYRQQPPINANAGIVSKEDELGNAKLDAATVVLNSQQEVTGNNKATITANLEGSNAHNYYIPANSKTRQLEITNRDVDVTWKLDGKAKTPDPVDKKIKTTYDGVTHAVSATRNGINLDASTNIIKNIWSTDNKANADGTIGAAAGDYGFETALLETSPSYNYSLNNPTQTYEIEQRDIGDAKISKELSKNFFYALDGDKPTLTVEDSGLATNTTATLEVGKDFITDLDAQWTDAWENTKGVAEKTFIVKINGIGNYKGEATVSFKVVYDLSICTLELGYKQGPKNHAVITYDGADHSPDYKLSWPNGNDVDKKLYQDNMGWLDFTNANTGSGTDRDFKKTIRITASNGSVSGFNEKSDYFILEAKRIDSSDISATAESAATNVKTKVTVRDNTIGGGSTLTDGQHFTYYCTNNSTAGTGTAVISGMNNYQGTRNVNYTVQNSLNLPSTATKLFIANTNLTKEELVSKITNVKVGSAYPENANTGVSLTTSPGSASVGPVNCAYNYKLNIGTAVMSAPGSGLMYVFNTNWGNYIRNYDYKKIVNGVEQEGYVKTGMSLYDAAYEAFGDHKHDDEFLTGAPLYYNKADGSLLDTSHNDNMDNGAVGSKGGYSFGSDAELVHNFVILKEGASNKGETVASDPDSLLTELTSKNGKKYGGWGFGSRYNYYVNGKAIEFKKWCTENKYDTSSTSGYDNAVRNFMNVATYGTSNKDTKSVSELYSYSGSATQVTVSSRFYRQAPNGNWSGSNSSHDSLYSRLVIGSSNPASYIIRFRTSDNAVVDLCSDKVYMN